MMKDALLDIARTARTLLGNRRVLILFAGVYGLLLLSLTLFVTTREASIPQVLLTLLMVISLPLLFFVLQAMCVSYNGQETWAVLLRRGLRNWWKLLVASVPLLLIAAGLYLLLGKLETLIARPASDTTSQVSWTMVLLATLRLLLFGFVIPLAAIHLWMAFTRERMMSALRHTGRVLAGAFAPRSVLTYTFGLVIFGVLPYLILAPRTPVQTQWAELSLLGLRIAVACALVLFGWVITLGALSHQRLEAEG